jgi:hypothetical protein
MSGQGNASHCPQTSIPFSLQQPTGRQGSSPHAVSRQPGHLPDAKSVHVAQFTPQYAISGSVTVLPPPFVCCQYSMFFIDLHSILKEL